MGTCVLVVDDDEAIVEVIQIVLEGAGYLVRVCMNGSCLQTLEEDLPGLILLDVLLSGYDGREICQTLKRDGATQHIPIILLSAHSDAEQVAVECGADDFLAKPFDVDMLIDVVGKHLSPTRAANL